MNISGCFILYVTIILISLSVSDASELPVYELNVKVDLESRSIEGRARITVPYRVKTELDLEGVTIGRLYMDGKEERVGEGTIELNGSGVRTIEFDYASGHVGVSDASPNVMTGADSGMIMPDSIVLLSGWYPRLKGLSVYRLTVDLPSGLEAVSEADAVTVTAAQGRRIFQFHFQHPLPVITLVAGRYFVREADIGGITVRTYLFSDDSDLFERYIEKTRWFMELYRGMLGGFPYKSFSIVEVRPQAGYSFPSYVLLGSDVIRLPFIPETSLGHEIVHQWFGCHVYVDSKSGDWSEGLTTYLSDHWYEELKGRGAGFRKRMMINYINSSPSEGGITLRGLSRGNDGFSMAVGYGKGAMLFHMLRRMVGDEAFFIGLRQFILSNRYMEASWDDIRHSFEKLPSEQPGKSEEIRRFFNQWLDREGVPSIDVGGVNVTFRDGRYLLRLNIKQKGEPYSLSVPLRVATEGGEEDITLTLNEVRKDYEVEFKERPLMLYLDRNYDIMRNLTEGEMPPVISGFTGDRSSIVVVPEGNNTAHYEGMVDTFGREGYRIKPENELTISEIKENSLLLFSTEGRTYRRLFGGRQLLGGGFVVEVKKNPLNRGKVIMVVEVRDREGMETAARKIKHYGNYSLLVFEGGENTVKETAASDDGIIKEVTFNAGGVEVSGLLGIDGIVERISDRRIVYIGESHTEYSHHLTQYEIIRRLYRKNGRLVIGMEMFQRPFQGYIDQYISGDISEEEFLRKTEYFTRWAYDYNLYRDILHFARANHIPVIALNLRKELVEKVSMFGIDSLTEEEYSVIPQEMDMTNSRYREHLRFVFSHHKNNSERDFENFLQSQILWDETMAHTVAEALKRYPGHQMVVLAGNGHLQHSWGIPDRVRRLTDQSSAVILNAGTEGIEKGLADFVIYPSEVEAPKSPLLKVHLKKGDDGLIVEKVSEGGPAQKAGIREGDIIKEIDGSRTVDIPDIKIMLLNKKKGDRIRVIVSRRVFILGRVDTVLDVEL